MKSPRLVRTGALVEIARILMQKRWQNSVADQASGNSIGKASSQPLAISFRALMPFARIVTSLLDACPRSRASEEERIGEAFVCQVKLHPRSKRLGMRFVGHKKIRYKAENALLFFSFELLGSYFLRRVTHSDCPLHSQDAKFDLG